MKEFENPNIDKELADLIAAEVNQIMQEIREEETADTIIAELLAEETMDMEAPDASETEAPAAEEGPAPEEEPKKERPSVTDDDWDILQKIFNTKR